MHYALCTMPVPLHPLRHAHRAAVPGLGRVAGTQGAELEAALEGALRTATIEEWVKRLNAAGIGAHRVVNDTRDLMDDPWVQAHGLSLTREHAGLGLVTTTGPAPRLSRTPVMAGPPAPALGADAAAILGR